MIVWLSSQRMDSSNVAQAQSALNWQDSGFIGVYSRGFELTLCLGKLQSIRPLTAKLPSSLICA